MSTPLADRIARNLKAAVKAKGDPSLREIARQADVSPSSIRYILDPSLRSPTHKGATAPNLDVIEKIARALGLEAWQLMTGDLEAGELPVRTLTAKEAEFYEKIKTAYDSLS